MHTKQQKAAILAALSAPLFCCLDSLYGSGKTMAYSTYFFCLAFFFCEKRYPEKSRLDIAGILPAKKICRRCGSETAGIISSQPQLSAVADGIRTVCHLSFGRCIQTARWAAHPTYLWDRFCHHGAVCRHHRGNGLSWMAVERNLLRPAQMAGNWGKCSFISDDSFSKMDHGQHIYQQLYQLGICLSSCSERNIQSCLSQDKKPAPAHWAAYVLGFIDVFILLNIKILYSQK